MKVSEGLERFDVIVGREVRRRREERGYSQAALAQKMSDLGFRWHQTAVAKTEQGSRPLKFSEAYALTGVLAAGKLSALFGDMQKDFDDALLWRLVDWMQADHDRSLEEVRQALATQEFRNFLKETRQMSDEADVTSRLTFLEFAAREFDKPADESKNKDGS